MNHRPKYKKQKYQTYRINVEDNLYDLGLGEQIGHQTLNPKKKVMLVFINMKSLCSEKGSVKRTKE